MTKAPGPLAAARRRLEGKAMGRSALTWYQQNRAEGGCGRCGQPSKKAYCSRCLAPITASTRLKRSGVSEAQYAGAFLAQGGRCLICQVHQSKLKKALAADHNRQNGQFRGLLCGRCNLGIGLFSDNPLWLVAAIRHLALHKRSLSDTGAEVGELAHDPVPSLTQVKRLRRALGELEL